MFFTKLKLIELDQKNKKIKLKPQVKHQVWQHACPQVQQHVD